MEIHGRNLRARMISGFVWVISGTILARAMNLALTVVIARILGKHGYGEYGMMQSALLMIGYAAGRGLGMTTTRYVALWQRSQKENAGKVITITLAAALVLGVVSTMLCGMYAQAIATNWLASPGLSLALIIGSPILFIELTNGVCVGILSGLEKFKRQTIGLALVSALIMPITIVLTIKLDLIGSVIGMTLLSAATLIWNAFGAIKAVENSSIPVRFEIDRPSLSILWAYTLPSFLATITVSPVTWLCYLFLARLPNGYLEIASVNAVNQWRNVILMIPAVIGNVALPILSSLVGDKTDDNFIGVVDANHKICTSVAIPLLAGISAFGSSILAMYGNGYVGAENILTIIVAGVAISIIGSPAGSILQAKGRMWAGAWMNLGWATIHIGVVMLYSRDYGGLAFALGFLTAHIVQVVWNYLYVRRSLSEGIVRRTVAGIVSVLAISLTSIATPSEWKEYFGLTIFIIATLAFGSPVFKLAAIALERKVKNV